MSRKPSPPRLWLKPEEIDKRTGKTKKHAVWVIKDGDVRKVTGCSASDFAGAEQALADYLTSKYSEEVAKPSGPKAASEILVTDVLAFYAVNQVPSQKNPDKCRQRLAQLGEWWAGRTLDEIDGDTVDEYVEWRCSQPWKSARPIQTGNDPRMVTPAGVRRELEDLKAAINFHRKKGKTREVIEVPLPERSDSRVRWLTRLEVARFLWVCWRTKEVYTVNRGTNKGRQVSTKRYRWRHIARFILMGVYTGTRSKAILKAAKKQVEGCGYYDVERGLFYRRADGQAETNKRQPPVPPPQRLNAHVERWTRDRGDQTISKLFLIEYEGKPVEEVNKGFAEAAKAAGFGDDVTPHVVRHTAATWLMINGADIWAAAGFLGMTVETLTRVYGHHHPDYQADARDKITMKPKRILRLVEQKQDAGPNGDRMTENEARRATK